jgi:hypothetical protein
METLFFPSVNPQPAPAAEAALVPGDAPEQGGFLRVLAGRLVPEADGNGVPEDQREQAPHSTLMAAFLAAFAGSAVFGLSPEIGYPSGPAPSGPEARQTSTPNSPPPFPFPLLAVRADGAANQQVHGEKPDTFAFPLPPAADLSSQGEEQARPPGGVVPQQDFTPEGKAQAEKAYVVPESRPGKTSSGTFPPPDVRATSNIAGEMNQEKVEPFDPPAQTKNAPAFPQVQGPVSGKEAVAKENGEQTPIAGPPAGAKAPVREEAQIPPPPSKDPAFSPTAREFPTPAQDEKESQPFPGTRQGQFSPSGKESQAFLGVHGASTASAAAPPLGDTEKMAAGREAPAPMKFDPQGIFQQVGERFLWLIRNQEERIRMSLNPPELGHLFLEIHRTKENVKATLYTDNPVTKVILEASHREIQRIIENEGFKMERFDVLVQQDSSRFQERKDPRFDPDSRSPLAPEKIEAPVIGQPDSFSPVPRRMHSASRHVDLFV